MPRCALYGQGLQWVEPLGGACHTFVLLDVGVEDLKDAEGVLPEAVPLYEGIEITVNVVGSLQ